MTLDSPTPNHALDGAMDRVVNDHLVEDSTFQAVMEELGEDQAALESELAQYTELRRVAAQVEDLELTIQSRINEGDYDAPTHAQLANELNAAAAAIGSGEIIMEAGVESFADPRQSRIIATYALEAAHGLKGRIANKITNVAKELVNNQLDQLRKKRGISGRYRALIQKEIERIKGLKDGPQAKGSVRYSSNLGYVLYGSDRLEANQTREGIDQLVDFQTKLNQHMMRLATDVITKLNRESDLFEAAKILRDEIVPKSLFVPDGSDVEEDVPVKRYRTPDTLIGSTVIYLDTPELKTTKERHLIRMLKRYRMYAKTVTRTKEQIERLDRPQGDAVNDWIEVALHCLDQFDQLLANDTRYWSDIDRVLAKLKADGDGENRYRRLSEQMAYYALINRGSLLITASARALSGVLMVLKLIK